MIWRLLARTVAAVHITYTVFVVVGSLLVLVWPSLLWAHLIAVLWAGATLGFDLGCPLTPWEKRFWRNGGVEPYPEGFLQHHVLHTRFDPATERRNHILLGSGAVLFNVLVYLGVWWRSR
ncbi:MAG: DUF2784 domain-containing protein [Gemmatimonadaceae bacterium]